MAAPTILLAIATVQGIRPNQCWPYLESQTYTQSFRATSQRIGAALAHMQQAFCKGSAY